MNIKMKLAKRIMAMALALSMMLTTLGGYVPGWFMAFAEEGEVLKEVQTEDNPVSDSGENKPAKPDKTADTPTEAKTEETADTPAEEKSEETTDTPAEVETEEAADTPTETKAEETADTPTETKTEESADTPTEAETEESADTPTEAETEESTDIPAEAETDESADTPTEAETEESADTPTEAETEESTDIPAETEPEDNADTFVETEPEETADTSEEATSEDVTSQESNEEFQEENAGIVDEATDAPAEDQVMSATALPARFALTMAAPTNAEALQQDGEGADSGDEIETVEPVLEVANVAATMAVPRANAALMAAPLASNATADDGTAEDTAAPETEDRTIALQQLVKDKIASLTTLTGIVQIVLAKNTTFEGDVEITKSESQTVADDFQLQLIAEDALDENGAVIEGGGSGKTVVSGNVKISGMSVLMRGVMIALGKKITVSDAVLTYEGTGEADVLEVELAKNGSAQIHTYAGEDDVSVALYDGARNAEVDTGLDDDKVSVTGYDGSADVETGDGDDTVKLNLQSGTGAVNVDTGAGADKVDARIANSGTTIKTDDGADTVEIDAQYGSDNINVGTGAGDDRVSVKKSDDLYSAEPSGKMTIDLGGGASRLDVDLSVGKGYVAIETKADKAAGSRLHLTGELNDDTSAVAEDKRIEWASDAKTAIVLHPADGKTLTIGMKDFASLTDALENKQTKKVSEANGNYADFTNYTLDNATNTNGVKSWSRDNAAAPENLTLTNLVLGAAQEDIQVGDVNAAGFNLLIHGKEIDLSGTVQAKNIAVLAKDEHDISLKLTSDSILGKAGDLFDWIGNNFDQNIVRTARINVAGTAKLYATNDIDLSAQVEQSGGLLNSDLLTMVVNPVNVKVGTAEVNIASGAQLAAGYGADGTSAPSGSGSITAEAKVTTDMSAGDGKLSLPIAVNVAVQNASVQVEKDAVLKTAGNIHINAESKIEAKAEAPSKAASKDVPFAVAVNVILNNATVDVNGKLTAGKDVTVSALGDMTSSAVAKHEGDGLSGVFVGVNVPLQNVHALLGESAVVTAGGKVNVKSTANEKATTVARSGSAPAEKSDKGDGYATEQEDSGFGKTTEAGLGLVKEYIGGPLGNLWGKIKGKVVGLFKKAPTAEQKMDKYLKSVTGGEYTVKLAEESEQKGDVKFDTKTENGIAYTTVDVTPWEGYQVDKVYYVYLNNENGQDATTKYTVEALDWDDYDDADGAFKIPQKSANVLVYVTYKEGSYAADDPDNWTPDDLFNENDDDYSQDLQSLFDDATAGAQSTDDDDYGEDLQRLFDEDAADGEADAGDKLKFSIEPTQTKDDNNKTVGSILNAQFSKSTGESITTVAKNGKVTFVVNAKKGYKLKDDGLVVTYYVEGEEKEQKAVLKDDGNGRYTFTVPDGILTNKYAGGIAFKVVSEFEKKDSESDNNVDQTQTQFNGSVAVTVAMNDNRAEIQSGASVTAGKAVNVSANEETRVDTNTDGTGVVKNAEKEKEKKPKQEEQQKLLSGQYIVTGKEVSLTLDKVSGGTVDVQQNGTYGYTFTPKQNGTAVTGATATLRFMKDGKWQEEKLTANGDGTYSVNLTNYAIDKGTQAVLGFAMPSGSSETQAKRDLVDYTMNVSYNVFQKSKEEDPYNVGNRKIGNVYYIETTGEGSSAKYFFDIQPDWAKGYTVDGTSINSLWASYTDGSGAEKKVKLHQDAASKYWYVQASDLTGIAQGGKVTVNVRFTEDKHNVVVPRGTTAHGKLTFSQDKAKAADVITIKATPDQNYGAGKITVHYTNKNTGRTETVELTCDEDGKVKFTMPVLADSTSLYVSAVFNEKTLTLKKDTQSTDVSIDTASKVSAGEKIAVALTNDAAQAGKKLNDTAQVTYTPKEGQRKTVQVDVKDGKITLPDDIADSTDVQIAVGAVEKAIALNGGEGKLDHGTLKIASARADKGEKVVVTITPEAGYRFKQGSGTVEITTGTSTYKVKLTRKDDSSLTFTMPSSMTSAELTEAKVNVTLKGEFEKGNPDSSTYQTSIGAAAAVAVVNAKNSAVVSGGSIKSNAVNVTAVTVGKSKISTSAGYSKAVTGLAGGFGVQVASFDTDALVKQAASIDAKALTVSAKGTHGLETTGSAVGAKDAGTTGVGSGIAVNVSSADVTAAIQDGTSINMGGGKVKVAAVNKTNDKVTAKAGAKGDTGVTPVIGVDVFGSSASAYLGNVKGTVLNAKTVSVTASNNAGHDMKADASTGGGSVALGGAFAVTVIHDESLARLNTSIKNAAADSSITVSATTNATQNVTATAGVTGGVKGKAGKNGSAGSADKQVDSILGGASNIAASKKSNSLSMKGSGSDNRQKAQTSEGSVGGAAAVAVNVLSTGAVARIMDGSTINIGGALAVKSVNRTETKVKANGSTAKTDTGVGVAVAVNIVDIENTAEIGTGSITAGSLEVSALMPEKADNAVDQMTTVKMPESKDAMVAQLADTIKDGINDALSELGVDQSVIGELAATFSETFVEYVLKETGLSDLLGDGTFDEKVDKVLGDLGDLWESVKDYPTVLLEPLATLKDEIAALGDVDVDQLKDILLGELKTQLPNLLKNTSMAVLNRAKDDLGALALEALNNKLKGKDQSSTKEKAKETLKNAVKAEWTKLSGELMDDALTRLRSEVPVLTQQNIDTIKSAFTTSLEEKKDGFVNYFTDTFQSKVFNYSAVMDKITNTDFATKAKEMMRGALNASTAAVGNRAIEALVNNLDVQLVPEDVSDKHVIRTEAISGAAAKDVGIAGSVAIAIVNADTRAAVNSGSALNIAGDATVDAREARRVTTAASAALDANGNADTNKGAGRKEEKDTAGSDAAQTVHLGEQLEVKAAAGATLAQDASDKDIVWITPRDGWKIAAGADKAKWSYTNDKGEEKTGKLQVYSKKVNGETRYYVKASDATTANGKLTTITVTPEEDLHTITGLDAINLSENDATKGKVPDGAVSVTVDGRDEAVKDGKLSARVTDTVKISIDKTKLKGLKVDSIDYITADGKIHEVPLSSTENGNQIVFTFTMPAQNVTGILVEVDEADENNSNASQTAATDSKGRSVGVGASFAMVYGDSSVKAEINRNVTAGALTVNAESDHVENTSSVSGTDALTGESNIDAMKKTSVDASVALDILDNAVSAILTGTATTTKGDLALTAGENAVSETRASGYAVGSETAVGAAAAVNIASSAVNAEATKDLTVAGSAKVDANSHSEDVTRALATAMGADIARAMNKVGTAAEKLEEKSNDLLQGKLFDGKTDGGSNKNNQTADNINKRLDKKKGEGGENSSKNLSLSSNALRNQNVTTNGEDAGSEGTDEATSQIAENTDSTISNVGGDTKSKVQVAAAVGVTVASHDAAVKVGKITAGKDISATAENSGNFNTMGTGAAMSLAQKANSIALGVAVSVNNNKAKVESSGDLVSNDNGDIKLVSTLTQNLDGDFAGKLAVQALSGSVAGGDSTISLGGAVSVLASKGESSVSVTNATSKAHRKIQGGDVTIEATDKSRLTARAGGISLSKGSSVGMGIASANVISGNTVSAKVGNYADITAGSFRMNAEKKAVTDDDFKQNIDMRYLVTDSSKLTDEQRKEANTGLIDVHKDKGDDNYTVDINLSSDKLLNAVEGLNFLSGQNTYVEAIAGSIATGKTKANLAGSFAVAVARNKIEASLGTGVNVNLSKSGEKDGSMTLGAENGTTARIIAGSVSAAPAKAAVGATVAVLVDSDKVTATVGRSDKIKVAGDYTQRAVTSGNIQLFTGAMSVAAGVDGGANAVGGAVNVIVTRNDTESTVGNSVSITAGGSAKVASETAFDLVAISGSANVAASAGSAVAAGGTVNVIVDKSTSETKLGTSNTIKAAKDLSVTSDVSDQMISGTASLSAAASSSGKSGAGAVNVIVSKSVADTTVGLNAKLEATGGDLKATANNDAWMLNAGLAASGSGNVAVGGAINVNVFNRSATVNLANGTITAGRNLITQASGRDTDIMAGLSLAAGVTGAAVSGNVVVAVMNSNIQNLVSRGVTATAGGSAVMESYYSGFDVAAAGNAAASATSPAVGVATATVVRNNDVRTQLAASSVTAKGGAALRNLSGKDVDGVFIGANAGEQQVVAAAGIAASGSTSVNGTVAVLVNSNKVTADASQASLKAEKTDIGVEANDDTHQLLLAGGLTVSAGAGVGAAVTTLVSGKEIQAVALNMDAGRNVSLQATNKDDVTQLSVSAGISGGAAVQIGAAVQVLKSRVAAHVGTIDDDGATKTVKPGVVNARNGSFKLNAQNDTDLDNIGVAVGISGSAAITPVGVVTYFQGEADARLREKTAVTAANDIAVIATGKKDINMVSVGAAAGSMGISGTVNVLVSKEKTRAVAESGTKLTTAGGIDIDALNDYKLRSSSAAIAAGSVGVAVNAVVSVLKSNVTAELGGTASALKNVNVKADSSRDVLDVVATVGAGEVGVGVTAMVLVAGTKMSQDAADMVAYGNADSKSKENATFDAETFMANAEKNGAASKYYSGKDETDADRKLDGKVLAADIAGNGHHESENSVGSTTTKDGKRTGTFDGSSGYMDDDMDYLSDYSDNGEDKAFSDDKQQGEDLEAKDSEDVTKAKNLNTYTYDNEPSDQVVARITTTGSVEKAEGVSVIADQKVSADLFGATLSAGAVGVGVSAAVAVLHSNVTASSLGNVRNVGDKGIEVSAKSHSGDVISDGAEERDSALDEVLDELNPRNHAIRAVGVSVGAGAVGVAVGASVVLTDNVTQAILGGKVDTNGNTDVIATHDYGNVLAATASVSGGAVAAGASVSVAQANGTVKAEVIKSAVDGVKDEDVKIETRNLTIRTDTNVNVNALAATASAGAVSVNGGVALAFNRLNQSAGIREGANVTTLGDLTMVSTSVTTADSSLLGVSFGAVGAALGAAMSDLDAKIDTAIEKATLSVAGKLTVQNDVSSTATPRVLSVAAGAAGIAGNVLLAFNDSQASARIEDSTIAAGDLDVISDLSSTAKSSLASLAVGGHAIGISVNYADLRAVNQAAVRGGTVSVTGDMSVRTGVGTNNTTKAIAETISGTAGALAVGLNAAVARNNSKNIANLSDIQRLTVGKTLTVHASGSASTDASLTGLDVGVASVQAAVVVSMNDADNRTLVSVHNAKVGGMSTFNATQNAATDANIKTGGGSLMGLKANVAAAYGRAASVVDVTLDNATGLHGITAMNRAGDATSATIKNQNFSMLSAQAMVGLAYSQDVFDTRVKLKGDNTVNGDVNINTNYLVTGSADITPSTMGIDASLAKLALNIGLARNTAYAGAALESEDGASTVNGSVNVSTDGAASTESTVHAAKFSISAVGIGANLVSADLAATQAAQITLDNTTLHITGNADVQSRANNTYLMRQMLKLWKSQGKAELAQVDIDSLNNDAVERTYKACGGTDASTALSAAARLGTSGGEGIDASLINVKVNLSEARENMRSTAAILGKDVTNSILNVDDGMSMFAGVKEGVKTSSLSRTDGAMEIAIASIGILDGKASSNDSFNVALQGVDVSIGGHADLRARTDTSAYGHGTTAGGLKLAELDISDIKAGIGTKDAKETAKILLGDGVKLTAHTINMEALNQGVTEAFYKKGTTVSLLDVAVASMPTESYYDTGVSIGEGAVVTANGNTAPDQYALNIASETRAQATSNVSAKQISIGFNVEVMEGTNYIYDDNIIDIGKNAKLHSVGSMNISTLNNTRARATTDLMGIGAVFSGTFSGAKNVIDRVGRINILDGASLTTANGTMNLSTVSGTEDDIYTYANADSGGLIALGEAKVTTDLSSENSILIGGNVNMISAKDMNLFARSTSHKADGSVGVFNKSNVDVGGLGVDINSKAGLNLLYTTAIYINRGGTQLTQLQTTNAGSNIDIRVDNEGLKATNEARGVGGGAIGFAIAEASLQARLQNNIWVDKTNLFSEGKTTLLATNSITEAGKPKLAATSYANLKVVGGKLTSHAIVHGDAHNQIRSNNTDAVTTKGEFIHIAVSPSEAIQHSSVSATYDKLPGMTTLDVTAEIYWEAMKRRCDFCMDGEDVTPKELKTSRGTSLKFAMEKALAPISDIRRMVNGLDEVTKARYGEEDDATAGQIYVLDVEALLTQNVTFDEDRLEKYRMWTNTATQHDVYLLPSATRLYRNVTLDYVSEVIRGDVRGDGGSYLIDIFTALNANAFRNPVIPIGSTGSLDFSTGIFTLPELADFELYLHEVSGAWLLEQLDAGFFRRLDADQALANAYALDNGATLEQTLPAGRIIEGLTEEGVIDGWRRFWLGDTPETAQDNDQTLIYLLWNKETDEVDAFRTSKAMIEAGDADIDVSLYIFRDSKSDRRGEEKYNILFYDTPEGEKSLVKVVTDVLEERELEMPRPIRIVLRGFDIGGADLPVYSLTDHFFAMCDGTDGEARMFDGFYNATFDGDTFESDYTKIEGILNNDLTITIKKGQPIWPEWTGDNTAEDIQGNEYIRVNDEWYLAEEAPRQELNEDAVAA